MFGIGADIYYYDDMGVRRDLPFDFTEFGAAVLDECYGGVDASVCIDEVVERFMDELDYWWSKLQLVDNGFKRVTEDAMEHPLDSDYEYEIALLNRNRETAQEAIAALEQYLGMILGRDMYDREEY